MEEEHRAYKPIADYGVIGNSRTVALIGLDGSIDWCCLPWMDSPSVFAALLDCRRGGRFLVRARGHHRSSQRYVEETNVLVTTMATTSGCLTITDFMPVGGSLHGCHGSTASPEIHRLIRCESGRLEVEVEWSPRLDYAMAPVAFARSRDAVVARSATEAVSLAGLAGDVRELGTPFGAVLRSTFRLRAGEEVGLVTRYGDEPVDSDLERAHGLLEETISAWRRWVHTPQASGDRSWAGPYRAHVIRSELTLKLLSFAGTGAIAAAPTTSLPERIGGVRNWDYRFAWIRDAAQTAQAFFAMGHAQEVDDFIRWAERVSSRGDGSTHLPILHGLQNELPPHERALDHLEGYLGSRPVRIGNAARGQLQLDVFGELMDAVYERVRTVGSVEHDVASFLGRVADAAERHWREPDHGIWEHRNGPFHFVYTKAMAAVALERAVWLAKRGLISGDTERWARATTVIRKVVLSDGYDAELGAFVQRLGAPDLDAANLLIPMMDLLPFEDPRVQGTIDRTLERLTDNDLVYRYCGDDGLPGAEGAFVLCTFWMVDALALSNRMDEAYRVFENVVGRANHLGLLPEQIDPREGTFLGNFPQAYSHVGLINSALLLAYREGRETPVRQPLGSLGMSR